MVTTDGPRNPSRAEVTADQIGTLARLAEPGTRLGSRDDLRHFCGVSVGTLHEALRLLQATGEITVRTGPGGGIFAGSHSALAGLLRDVRDQARAGTDYPQTGRILTVLAPLILSDAIDTLDTAHRDTLQQRLGELQHANTGSLQAFIRASLELFATIVSIPESGLLRIVAGALVRAQIELLPEITTTIDPHWQPPVNEHLAFATVMVDALIAGDLPRALDARLNTRFDALFTSLRDNKTMEALPSVPPLHR